MWSGMVIPASKFHHHNLKVSTLDRNYRIEVLLESAEESLDSSILPGAVWRDGL
ncbi:hypothetical protein SAMN05660971_00371 [Halomonas cupida]|uniref:Uncharacterized protein n=1 Tax=Halomonas cupida TaxID=44933 RepID=A0A1M7A5M5_9GAMM|nr:hypothetical protein SAMN05660971_00371 [Halomonas cupida]